MNPRLVTSISLTACCLVLAFVIGRATAGQETVLAGSANQVDLDATATRMAELDELDELRTRVAQPLVCTPAATSTPAPTATPLPTATLVPPVAAGQPMTYAGDWTVTVQIISLVPTFDILTADGTYAIVRLTLVNGTAAPRVFPYEELVLRDEHGNVYLPDSQARAVNAAGWFSVVPPSTPTDGMVIFDIQTDAHGPFILESSVDPTFRVEVEEEIRG
jgi:hypothetical protein